MVNWRRLFLYSSQRTNVTNCTTTIISNVTLLLPSSKIGSLSEKYKVFYPRYEVKVEYWNWHGVRDCNVQVSIYFLVISVSFIELGRVVYWDNMPHIHLNGGGCRIIIFVTALSCLRFSDHMESLQWTYFLQGIVISLLFCYCNGEVSIFFKIR